jgi:hypothetical protein
MSRSAVVTFCFWLVLAFVTWNVVFDRRVATAAVAFTREQTGHRQRGQPITSIADGFSPQVRTAALRATLWAGGIAALGVLVSLSAARWLRRPPQQAPPRPPEAGKTNAALARRSRSRQAPKAEAQPR